MKNRKGNLLMALGLVLLLAALALVGYNKWDARRAQQESEDALMALEQIRFQRRLESQQTAAPPVLTDAPATDATTSEATDVPTTEVPTTEVPTTDVPTSETTASPTPTAEAAATDALTTEIPRDDVTANPTSQPTTTDAPATANPTNTPTATDAPATASPTNTATATNAPATASPTSTPTATNAPTAQNPTSRPNPTDKATDAPSTATPDTLATPNPTATATPDMTETPVPTETPEPTPSPEPTPTPTPAPTGKLYERVPGMEMPGEKINGHEYIGTLSIPSLGLNLPVQRNWSYENLSVSPCRYSGSAYAGNFSIIAHTYYFGQLSGLPIGAVVTFTDMEDNVFRYVVKELDVISPDDANEIAHSGYDLTLATCTLSGTKRVAVYCERTK